MRRMQRTAVPENLAQAQRDWHATYQALATDYTRNTTMLRRRLLQLSTWIWWHPHRHEQRADTARALTETP